jgi:hypothetical protein
MVAKRQAQSDLSNYHFYDNETRSIRQTGIVLLDLIPHYYDTKRVMRIIGEDGTPDSVTINDSRRSGRQGAERPDRGQVRRGDGHGPGLRHQAP